MSVSTERSSVLGKAYEYACICVLTDIVSEVRDVLVEQNSSFDIAKNRFDNISKQEQKNMLKSAKAGIKIIIQMEPRIVERASDLLTISLQPDNKAKGGDIRDIIIIRNSINWEIGISVKHNHSALKHSRLSQHIDFGQEWFGKPCSKKYFETILPIFNNLARLKKQKTLWSQIANKDETVYVPILIAFMKEFNRLFKHHNKMITEGIIMYLLGSNGKDYYKLIHHNNHKITIVPFNINGTLNQRAKQLSPDIKIPEITLPTKVIGISLRDDSKTTVDLQLNQGWAVSFRIHNASLCVEPSLKFDIQLVGQPADLFYLDVDW